MTQGLSAASLRGVFAGCRGVHVPTTGNHPRDTWVVMYETDGETLYLYRTGTHAEVYGKKLIMCCGWRA